MAKGSDEILRKVLRAPFSPWVELTPFSANLRTSSKHGSHYISNTVTSMNWTDLAEMPAI
jgi:hypothetical protein